MDAVKINDKPAAFCQLLLFITDKILPKPNDYRMLLDLLTVAHTYNVSQLASICEHLLLRHITIETVIDIINIAFTCNAEYLIQCTAHFLKLHIKQFSRKLIDIMDLRVSEENSKKIIELISQNELNI
ncbi:hypothetical protein X777_11730 [Ooceraea biroi]|uniref:BTB domain-containing protein n=1 Tax=Ooceraea biroi TaxID=2015173 RepID=A0A026W1X2_OOCBI|nr:hypothetical protein X777_11730 [Ooceraea biroi]